MYVGVQYVCKRRVVNDVIEQVLNCYNRFQIEIKLLIVCIVKGS